MLETNIHSYFTLNSGAVDIDSVDIVVVLEIGILSVSEYRRQSPSKALGGKASIPSTVVDSSNVKMEGGRAMVEYTFGHTEVSLLLEETGDEVSGSHVVLQLFIFSLDGYVLIHEQKSRV